MKAALSEFLLDLKRIFKGWNLVILIGLTGLYLGMSIENSQLYLRIYMLYFLSWSINTLKPKINIIQYILPGDSESRMVNIACKSLGILLFNILFFSIIVIINVFLGNYTVTYGFQRIICELIPFLIAFISPCMINGYDGNRYAFKRKENREKYTKEYIQNSLLTSIPTFHALLLGLWIRGIWYFIITLVAYVCSIIIFYYYYRVYKDSDTSYENIKKTVKFI